MDAELDAAVESALEAFAAEERLRRLELRPSDYVRRQIRVTPYSTEPVGWIIEQSFPEVCLFSSDWPHVEGGRNPMKRFADSLAETPEAAQRRFYCDNFVDLMGAGLPARRLPREVRANPRQNFASAVSAASLGVGPRWAAQQGKILVWRHEGRDDQEHLVLGGHAGRDRAGVAEAVAGARRASRGVVAGGAGSPTRPSAHATGVQLVRSGILDRRVTVLGSGDPSSATPLLYVAQ
jgi:hypothetical protein